MPVAVSYRTSQSVVPDWRPVQQIDECWRVEDGWWRERPVSRRYFRLLLVGGVIVTLFQDLTDGCWYVQAY